MSAQRRASKKNPSVKIDSNETSSESGMIDTRRVAILVLGDIGRSPRMQYHAISLARAGWHVDLIGYNGVRPMEEVVLSDRITLHHIRALPQPTSAPKAIFYLYAPLKVLYQLWALFWVFFVVIQRPYFIFVQNPPAIPTLFVARICAFLTGANLVIDWHNYGHTILGMKMGSDHPVVKLATWFEHFFGRTAYAHLCVTHAMAIDLQERWKISGRLLVLHDKAPRHFRRLSASEIHKLWVRLLSDPQLASLQWIFKDTSSGNDVLGEHSALLTSRASDGTVSMRKNRPMLLVSSTSWTADEDFSILLDALCMYDEWASQNGGTLLVVLITGKGPLRGHYEAEIDRLKLSKVCIATAWLSAEDYPLLLGSADLGISLHTSSSGLDLPMKVVDMLGCGTPVCAYEFACIHELVDSTNGMVFGNASELAQQIQSLAAQLESKRGPYQRLLRGAEEFRRIDWETNYHAVLDLLNGFVK